MISGGCRGTMEDWFKFLAFCFHQLKRMTFLNQPQIGCDAHGLSDVFCV